MLCGMARRPRHNTTPENRAAMVALVRHGEKSRADVARMFHVSWDTVNRALNRSNKTGSNKDRKRSGRPMVTTARTDNYIRLLALKNRKLTAPEIRLQLQVDNSKLPSLTTVKTRLLSFGLQGRVARRKPLLRPENVKKRLQWAKRYLSFSLDDWSKVLWTDESQFQIFGNRRRMFVRRRKHESYLPDCIRPTVKHGGGSINVWGCFAGMAVGDLSRVDGIMDSKKYHQILVHHAIPCGQQLIGTPFIFQQDNDPKHKSKFCMGYLEKKESEGVINVMAWPPQSPDLSPIEKVWDELDRKIRQTNITSESSLVDTINNEWEKISRDYLQKLIARMPRICAAVIKSKGKWFDEKKV